MRCTEDAETPDAFAMSRVLQCVAPVGFSSSVLTTMASIWSSPLRIATCDLAPSNQTVKIGAFLTAERDYTRLRCPPRSHDGLRHSRHSLPNHSRAEMARNF